MHGLTRLAKCKKPIESFRSKSRHRLNHAAGANPSAVIERDPLWCFFGGGALGLGLAELFAPDSHAAQFISFLFLPLALILGFHAWLGLAVLTLVLRLIMRVLRSRAITENAQNGAIIPPGTVAFMPIASMLSLAAGVSVCWLVT